MIAPFGHGFCPPCGDHERRFCRHGDDSMLPIGLDHGDTRKRFAQFVDRPSHAMTGSQEPDTLALGTLIAAGQMIAPAASGRTRTGFPPERSTTLRAACALSAVCADESW